MPGGLWRDPAFARLWVASTVGALGTYIGRLALPTAAIVALDAGPIEVGVLASLQWAFFPVVGLLAGVLADRVPKRRVMIACDLGRLLALGSVPAAFVLGVPTMAHFYAAAAVAGILTVFFDAAYRSYLPSLVERKDLIEGNAKLELGQGAAQVGGPALAGALVQVAGAAVAVAADAFSYLVSALCLASIGKPEVGPRSSGEGLRAALREAKDGLLFVFSHPVLRPIVAVNTASNFGGAVVEALALLFAYRLLTLSPGEVGMATAVGSLGFVVGAAFAGSVAKRVGMGRTLFFSSLLAAASFFVLPAGLLGLPIFFYGFWRLLFGLAEAAYNPSAAGLRQAVTPGEMQGRAIATVNAFGYGALGVGSLVGGLLGSWIGLVPTILAGGALYVVGSL
ncbi:MAG: MFS transporter, partial [Actinomycetota bacterium]|nr:MFS transporter [Actinomycetota bacterium]